MDPFTDIAPSPGDPLQTLRDELRDLHRHAGKPSLRDIAGQITKKARTSADRKTISHTTVTRVFSCKTLPTWDFLKLVVEQLGGDVHYFHRLWCAAESMTRAENELVPTRSTAQAEPSHRAVFDISLISSRYSKADQSRQRGDHEGCATPPTSRYRCRPG